MYIPRIHSGRGNNPLVKTEHFKKNVDCYGIGFMRSDPIHLGVPELCPSATNESCRGFEASWKRGTDGMFPIFPARSLSLRLLNRGDHISRGLRVC